MVIMETLMITIIIRHDVMKAVAVVLREVEAVAITIMVKFKHLI